MSTRRVAPIILGVLLVIAGLVGFFRIDGWPADVVCVVAVAVGLGVIRIGSRPARDEIV